MSEVRRTYVRNERSFASADVQPIDADGGRGGAALGSCEGAASGPREAAAICVGPGAAVGSCVGAGFVAHERSCVHVWGTAARNLTKNFKFYRSCERKFDFLLQIVI